jgi:hypothetical protein
MATCSFVGCDEEHTNTHKVDVSKFKAGTPVEFSDEEYPVCEKHHWHVTHGEPYQLVDQATADGASARYAMIEGEQV